ncbi:DoxX family protein [Bacteroidota bacterium]|nr:DoxX family protein [Bacteroidota bacterium]
MNFIEKYKLLTIYVMSIMYIFIGIKHFTDPQYFLDIVPPHLPSKLFLVYFTGLIEVVGGAAILAPKTRKVGAYLLIFLLVSVFPANIYLYISETPQSLLGISKTDALIRMPFQIPLILIAFWHSKENYPKWVGLVSSLVFIPTIIYFLSI